MFRPQGLVTLAAVFSLPARVGFVSRRQRSWDSPFGASLHRAFRVSADARPARSWRWRCNAPLGRARIAMPEPPGRLRRRPFGLAAACLALRRPSTPVGFSPSGLRSSALIPASRDLLPRAWRAGANRPACASECLSANAPPDRCGLRRVGPGHPHGVPTPIRSASFEHHRRPGYVFTCRTVVHCCAN